jgi:hypothetical protein
MLPDELTGNSLGVISTMDAPARKAPSTTESATENDVGDIVIDTVTISESVNVFVGSMLIVLNVRQQDNTNHRADVKR